MDILKKIIEYIGIGFITVILFGTGYFIFRTIQQNTWVWLTIFIGCPFMAFAAKKSSMIVIYSVLLSSIICTVCVVTGNGKQQAFLESIFLKGEKIHHPVFVEEREENDGNTEEAHYETEYNFKLAPNQPIIVLKLINWGLFITAVGFPVIVFFTLKQRFETS